MKSWPLPSHCSAVADEPLHPVYAIKLEPGTSCMLGKCSGGRATIPDSITNGGRKRMELPVFVHLGRIPVSNASLVFSQLSMGGGGKPYCV